MKGMMYVNESKKLVGIPDVKLSGEFYNTLNELIARGYSEEESLDAFAAIVQEQGLFNDFYKQMGKDPKWKKFEKIIAGIHMLVAEGAEVKFDDHIPDRVTGDDRQIDVSVRFKQGLYDHLVIIECKDYGSRNVSMEKVEAFETKKKDVGATLGIMVSPKGFQKGAVKKAKFYNIELYTLTEVKSDWTKHIKAEVLSLPFPTNIELDYPYFDLPDSYQEPQPIQFGDMLFYKNQHKLPMSLDEIIRRIAKWVIKKDLLLPCKVTVPYDPPLLTRFLGTDFYTPIYSITVTLESHRLAVGWEVDMPPKLIKYVYSDIEKEKVHEIPAKDVPPIK
jgi:hypothetical protein